MHYGTAPQPLLTAHNASKRGKENQTSHQESENMFTNNSQS